MCFPGALAASTGGASSLLERGVELGEPHTSGKQEPGDPVPVLPPTHTHCRALSLGLSFPTCQTSTKPKVPSNLTALELFSVSDSGPEWSFRTTTSRVEVLEEEKGNQGRLPGGRGTRTQTQRLDHTSAQRPLPFSAEL